MDTQQRELAEIVENIMHDFLKAMQKREVITLKTEKRTRQIIYIATMSMVAMFALIFYSIYSLTNEIEQVVSSTGNKVSLEIKDIAGQVKTNYLEDFTGKANNYYTLLHENALLLSNTLRHIETITGTFSKNARFMESGLQDTAKTLDNIASMTEALLPLVERLNKSMVSVEKMAGTLVKTAEVIHQNADESINVLMENQENIQKITETAATAANKVSKEITTISSDIRYFTGDALPRISNLTLELGDLADSLRVLTYELRQRPNMLLFGKSVKPGPGESK